MTDLLLVMTLLVSFAAFVGLVRLCDRIVGPDELTVTAQTTPADDSTPGPAPGPDAAPTPGADAASIGGAR